MAETAGAGAMEEADGVTAEAGAVVATAVVVAVDGTPAVAK